MKKSLIAGIGAAITTAAVPIFLIAGTATAQASTLVTPESNALSVTVSILSDTKWGWCSYSAEPNGGWNPGEPLPVYGIPFHMEKNVNHQLWFPGIQTGTKWHATVKCDHGNPTEHEYPVY